MSSARPPRTSEPSVPIPLDTRSAVAMLAAELRSIRLLLSTLVRDRGPSQVQGKPRSESATARRSRAWREAKRAEGMVFRHGRPIARTSEERGGGCNGCNGGATGGATPLSDSLRALKTSVFQAENLGIHTPGEGQGATVGATAGSVGVISYFSVLEILRGSSPPLVLVAEARVERLFRGIVEELSARGVGESEWKTFARWVREGGKEGQGGYAWKTQGPPDLWFLSSPGTLAKGLGMAKQWAAKEARAKAKAAKTSTPRPSVPPPPRPSVPPPPLPWARKP